MDITAILIAHLSLLISHAFDHQIAHAVYRRPPDCTSPGTPGSGFQGVGVGQGHVSFRYNAALGWKVSVTVIVMPKQRPR
jgi:hypothetical protein